MLLILFFTDFLVICLMSHCKAQEGLPCPAHGKCGVQAAIVDTFKFSIWKNSYVIIGLSTDKEGKWLCNIRKDI